MDCPISLSDGLSGSSGSSGGNHGLGGHLSRGLYPGRAERTRNDQQQQSSGGRNRSTSSNYRLILIKVTYIFLS